MAKRRLSSKPSLLTLLAPGILVAATGVGAGDLLTTSLAGADLGLVILWAAIFGAVLKYALNEGLARWQLATDTTLLEGWHRQLGPFVTYPFLLYFLLWSFITAGALVNAAGVAGIGIYRILAEAGLPLPDLALNTQKVIFGIAHSLLGLALVFIGGFKFFERFMSVCIAVMFVAVMLTAILARPDLAAVGAGLLPGPAAWNAFVNPASLGLVLGVIGGVGGTVTLLSYGYWIREENRRGSEGLIQSRTDLAVGYAMTALFGIAMIIIGANLELTRGANLALDLAEQLRVNFGQAGPAARVIFLIGFWGAVFSSLLGVWQSVPYLFADFLHTTRRSSHSSAVDLDRTNAYRIYLVLLALVPLVLLRIEVKQMQIAYAVLGALFMPFLAATLLILNNRRRVVGRAFRNGPLANAALAITLLFFVILGTRTILQLLAP